MAPPSPSRSVRPRPPCCLLARLALGDGDGYARRRVCVRGEGASDVAARAHDVHTHTHTPPQDVALQFLGNLFEYFLAKRKGQESARLTILGATSGDTGEAGRPLLSLRGSAGGVFMYMDGEWWRVACSLLTQSIHP